MNWRTKGKDQQSSHTAHSEVLIDITCQLWTAIQVDFPASLNTWDCTASFSVCSDARRCGGVRNELSRRQDLTMIFNTARRMCGDLHSQALCWELVSFSHFTGLLPYLGTVLGACFSELSHPFFETGVPYVRLNNMPLSTFIPNTGYNVYGDSKSHEFPQRFLNMWLSEILNENTLTQSLLSSTNEPQ